RETGCIQYLVECGTANLQPDSALIEDTVDRTKPAMVYLMDRAIGYHTAEQQCNCPQVNGIVYDASTNQPIEGAIVEVLEHTGSVLKPRLTDEFGRYRRIMNPGTYTISIRARGYLPQEITAVTNNSGITTEDIFLEPAENHTLTLNLLHSTFNIVTIEGFIQNEFGAEEIQITTGENVFELPEGGYTVVFPMDSEFLPWEKYLSLTGDYSCNVSYLEGNKIMLSESWPWENAEGLWSAGNVVLRSQENSYYNNGDSTFTTQWMESNLIDISGTNRVVVSVRHKFETEWDYDPISIEILDENENVLGSKLWTGDHWDEYQTHLITAISETEFSQVKVRLEFSPDQTVNYRGWELQELSLYSSFDEYLDVAESTGGRSPKIPMMINGIYPNPSNGRLQVDLANYPGGKGTIRVYNLLGQEILAHALNNLSSGRHFLDLNLNKLSDRPIGSGMVFIRMETEKEQVVEKCVLLKN
ncbi:MAG: carboxypeptidase regulatory-like domain-containing protein, partial [Candidatus Neomarinimicrobiota bacterium]|nr:carboxypeptidase regulatory-like domain-containing protein [Candidatus Neomarinimicrobiota bacterium]